jgi:hypothetical protein
VSNKTHKSDLPEKDTAPSRLLPEIEPAPEKPSIPEKPSEKPAAGAIVFRSVLLLRVHDHAGQRYRAGDIISVEPFLVDWLVRNGIAKAL